MTKSEKKALVKVFPFRVARNELKRLPDDQTAFLGLLHYAISELNVFQRVYISVAHELEGKELLDAAIVIQRNTVLRVWSAKLFELMDTIGGLAKKPNGDETLVRLTSTASKDAEALKQHEGFELARNFRHESTSHYSFKAAQRNLKHLPEHADCNLYLTQMDGNSWYPMGEELMFIGRLNRHGANLQTKEEVAEGLNHWMEWNLKANTWARALHFAAFKEIIDAEVPERFARETWHWVNPKLVADVSSPQVPLFLRRSDQ